MLTIRIDNKKFNKKTVIHNIDLSLENGKMMLIFAPSGCGKSTLLKCILGETEYTGSVKCDERIISVSQDCTLNPKETVYNAVFYTAYMDQPNLSTDKLHSLTKRILKSLGLMSVSKHKIRNLSGGQQRRVQLAEALVRKSDVLIMDEPDSGLDVASSYVLTNDIRTIVKQEKKKAIIVSHQLQRETINLYDQVCCLSKDSTGCGTVAYLGRPCFLDIYFNQTSLLDLMLDLQPKEENGRGYGAYYTQMWRNLSEGKKKHYRTNNIRTETERY